MRYKVAYRIGKPPGRLTRMLTGMLSIDNDGVRIDGPAAYRADFTERLSLQPTNRLEMFCIAPRSSPAVFVTPILSSCLGIVLVIHPPLTNAVYTELHRRLGGPGRCAQCGSDRWISDVPCPVCDGSIVSPLPCRKSRWLVRTAVALALGLSLLAVYSVSYYHLSRRGMAEARAVGSPFFFYVPMREIGPSSPGLSHHYRLREFYAPINRIDRAWFGGGTPCGGITWGLSREPPRDR
jgi:hypothetical protein